MKHPYYGYRRMTRILRDQGFVVNRKRVRRLMQVMGLEAIYPEAKPEQTPSCHLHASLPASLLDNRSAESSLGNRHYLSPDGQRLYVPVSNHRLVQPESD